MEPASVTIKKKRALRLAFSVVVGLRFHYPVVARGVGSVQMTIGPWPKHDVVLMAVRKAVSAATITFTANSMIRCFFIFFSLIDCFLSHTEITEITEIFRPSDSFIVLKFFLLSRRADGAARAEPCLT